MDGSRTSALALGAAVVSLGALAVSVVVAWPRRPVEGVAAPGDNDQKTSRSPAARLQPRQVRAERAEGDDVEGAELDAIADADNAVGDEPGAAPASQPSEEAWIATRRALLDQRIQEERRDAWSDSTEAAVKDAVGSGEFGDISLEDIRCGATLCKLSASFHGNIEETRSAFEQATTRVDPVRGRVFMHFDGGFSATKVTTYFMRPGNPMPIPNIPDVPGKEK